MIDKDKKMHFLSGFAIAILVGFFFSIFLHWPFGNLIGLIIATIFGASKEYFYDYKWKKGNPEWLDFIFTVLGGLLAYFILQQI